MSINIVTQNGLMVSSAEESPASGFEGHVAVIPAASNAAQTLAPSFDADSVSIINRSASWVRATVTPVNAANFSGTGALLVPPLGGVVNVGMVYGNEIDSVSVVVVNAPSATSGVDALTAAVGPLSEDAVVLVQFAEK